MQINRMANMHQHLQIQTITLIPFYTETELNSSDGNPPDQGSNLMNWDDLTDLPSGFADGIDDAGAG